MIGHIITRLQSIYDLDGVVVATTSDPRNEPMISYVKTYGASIYVSPYENDIAERLTGAAKMTKADAILKVNGDCPLIDPDILNQMLQLFHESKSIDYLSNKIKWTFPLGMSAEIISAKALIWCHENLIEEIDRELVANWIRDHPDIFNILSFEGNQNLSHHQWCVDTHEDLVEVENIYKHLYPADPLFGLKKILDYLASSRE